MIGLGAEQSSIRVAIGPCLHQKNFEIGSEFYDHFIHQNPANEQFFIIPKGKRKYHFDLIGYLKSILDNAGIEQISTLNLDTYEHENLFFSYRRATHKNEPDYGRQLSVIIRTE